MIRRAPSSPLFPYTTLFRSGPGTGLPGNGLAGSLSRLLARCAGGQHVFTGCAGFEMEEHTSELQSQFHLVCRLLLEKKKKKIIILLKTIKNSIISLKTHNVN